MYELSIRSANIALETYSILICLILALFHGWHMNAYKAPRSWLVSILLCNVWMMLADLCDWLFNGIEGTVQGILLRTGMCCYYFVPGIMLYCLSGYLIRYMGIETKTAKMIRCGVASIAVIQITLTLVNLWTGIFYTITEENVYVRGPLFLISQLLPGIAFVLNAVLIWHGRNLVKRKTRMFLYSCIICPTIGQILQMLIYGGAYINVMVTISLLIIHFNLQSEQEVSVKQAEQELADLKVDIMLSQIHPHFLYNALAAIRVLCDTDTEQAKQSILDFSRFLRANMNSLTTKELIPFERELEHARSYLNLEQQRFGKKLKVIYDINAHYFYMPTLTLQPIVENAVRHGIRRREDGGTVKIYTEEWNDVHVIVVSDDGVGMEASSTIREESSHIGIANVRRRLETQCGGTMTIKSDSAGTVVTLLIPKKWKGKTNDEIYDG